MRRRDYWRGAVVVFCAVFVPICVETARSDERVIYVDAAGTGADGGSSWTDAYDDLQEALADAKEAPPAVIRVAQGTYRPGPSMGPRLASWQTTFRLHDHIALEGGYAGVLWPDPRARDVERYPTILSGDLAGNDTPGEGWDVAARRDNCWHVITGIGINGTAAIDGLTVVGAVRAGIRIDGATSCIRRCRFVDNTTSGVDIRDANCILTECAFERNGPPASGNAFRSFGGNAVLTDCVFIENEGAGVDGTGTLHVLRCSFVGNGGSCAGIRSLYDLVARECCFRRNKGTAIFSAGNARVTRCAFVENSSYRSPGAVEASGSLILEGCEFTGNSCGGLPAGAVAIRGDLLKADNCVFAGNSGGDGCGAIFTYATVVVRLSNCTFIGNRGRANAIGHPFLTPSLIELTDCVVWDGPDLFTVLAAYPPRIAVSHSNVQGGYAGQGNIDIDPLFVDPGYWDPNGTPDDPNDDFYVVGDYHLKSQAGHWDRATESWIFDEVTSPCIDAGDPNAPLGAEPFPNGGYVNVGTYGGTLEASRSYFGEPVCETHIAGDINGDCKVDDLDMDILLSHWLMPDIGKANIPPVVVLMSPQDAAAITAPTPIVLTAQASDPDGVVLRVRYLIARHTDTRSFGSVTSSVDPTNDWQARWNWPHIPEEGSYTIWAEAVDDDGAVAASPTIQVTLHP